jgi:hypothetical protein
MATRKTLRRARTRGATPKSAMRKIEAELPTELRQYVRLVRQGLTRLEKQVATARLDPRRSWTRLLREASHQLGRIEAEGERQWRKRTLRARREAVRLLRQLEKAIEPPAGRGRPRRAAKPRAIPAAAPRPAPLAGSAPVSGVVPPPRSPYP